MSASCERSSFEFRAASFRPALHCVYCTAPLPNHYTIAPVLVLTPATLLAWWYLLQAATGKVNHHRTACSVSVVISTHSCDSFVTTTSAAPFHVVESRRPSRAIPARRPRNVKYLSLRSPMAFPSRPVGWAKSRYTIYRPIQISAIIYTDKIILSGLYKFGAMTSLSRTRLSIQGDNSLQTT